MPQKPPIVHTFEIVESGWLHGHRENAAEQSALKLDDESSPDFCKKCCLGFLAISCGYSETEIYGYCEPSDLSCDDMKPLFRQLMMEDEEDGNGPKLIIDSLMVVNDSSGMTLKKRKAKLKKLFRSIGVNVRFISGDGVPLEKPAAL